MDLVTFLITTYNSERWIEECLNSVLNQTYKNLQILIIDDGSEDNTVDRIKKISDTRIELICKKHSGISKSLNFAIDKIKGEFVARLDSDDVCNHRRIEKQINFIRQNKSYNIVGTNFILIDEQGKKILKVRNPEKDEWIKDVMPRRCSVWMGSVLMRREILNIAGGFDERRYSAEDWDFFLKLIEKTKFYNIQEYLSSKRVHEKNITSTPKAYQESEEVLLNFNNNLISGGISPEMKSKGYFNIGYFYYYENNLEKAQQNFSEAYRLNKNDLMLTRYYFFSKYLKRLILFNRKNKLYRLYDWLKVLDRRNLFFKNRY